MDLKKSLQKSSKYPSEHDEQVAFVKWFESNFKEDQALIYAIPNGGLRDKKTAKKLKDEGVKKGIPDIEIIFDRDRRLFVEMKRVKEAKPIASPYQKKKIKWLADRGIHVIIGYGCIDASKKVLEYISNMFVK